MNQKVSAVKKKGATPKEKQIPDKFLIAIQEYPIALTGHYDLIEFLDEIDQLGSLQCTDEGGFKVFEEHDDPDKPTYKTWEAEVTKILEATGFKCGDWEEFWDKTPAVPASKGVAAKPVVDTMYRSIPVKANGKSFILSYC